MPRPLRSDRARAIANLAIDLGDPRRMTRARRLHRSGAVTSISVDPARISTIVYGSRSQPYHVDIFLSGSLPPGADLDARDLRTGCSCPDPVTVCKHALASILSFAEEAEAEPEVLDDFLGRAADDIASSAAGEIDGDPFFNGDVRDDDADGASPRFEVPALEFNAPTLVVDGVDAWPILASALREIVGEVSSRA